MNLVADFGMVMGAAPDAGAGGPRTPGEAATAYALLFPDPLRAGGSPAQAADEVADLADRMNSAAAPAPQPTPPARDFGAPLDQQASKTNVLAAIEAATAGVDYSPRQLIATGGAGAPPPRGASLGRFGGGAAFGPLLSRRPG